MTVMVEKRQTTVGDLGGKHPWDKTLPASVLDGAGDHEGDLDLAGKAAAEVYTNWDNDAWRNAFILALVTHIQHQVDHHRGELDALYNLAKAKVYGDSRRAVVKAYLHDVLNEMVSKSEWQDKVHVEGYTRGDGTRVSAYDRSHQAAMAAAAIMSGDAIRGADQEWEYTIRRGNGDIKTNRPGKGKLPKMSHGDRVLRATLVGGTHVPRSTVTDSMDIAAMLGANSHQQGLAGAVAEEMSRQGKIQYGPNSWFQRLESSSDMMHKISHGRGGLGTQIAIGMGKMVGKHGPEVSRVLGPHMRRYAYKYRGTTADPTQRTAISRVRPESTKGQPVDTNAYMEQLTLNLAHSKKDGGLDAIPTVAESNISLKSGSTVPSHGYILDSKGVVQQQAHGYADDHYVPFNLKQLHALNGGSYVRSRAYGGPTTEDISLAMMTGASGFNVISRNGVYRVRFTERTNKAGRKVGAWAKDTTGNANQIMVRRYARLLDAIKNGQVTDPENEAPTELNGRGYELALKALHKQFPYFIRSVEFTPASDRSLGNTLEGVKASAADTDKGYVRPFYLKPHDAYTGWHDPVLGGPGRSFDEFENYRLGRATALKKHSQLLSARFDAERAAQAALEQRERELAYGRRGLHINQGQRGQTPTTVNAGTRQTAAAAGTQDIGQPVRSYPWTQGDWSGTEVGDLIDAARAVLQHAQASDDQSIAYRPMLIEPTDAWIGRLQRDEDGARTDLIDHVNAIAQEMALGDENVTGLNALNEWERVSSEPQDKIRSGPSASDHEREDEDDLKQTEEGKNHQRYQRWKGWKALAADHPLRSTPEFAALKNEWETQTILPGGANMGTKLERYESGVDPDTGLTAKEEFENRLSRARGLAPKHQPRQTIAPPSDEELKASDDRPKGRTTEEVRFRPQAEDESDEEYERRSDQAVDELMRELGGDPDARREEPPF